MKLMNRLLGLANRVGLIRIVEAPPAAAAPHVKVTTRTLRLDDLAAEIRAEAVRALAELPAEMSVSFEQVYETAGIRPDAGGWTILRLAQLLHTEQYQAMDRAAAQQAVLGVLAADQAAVEDLVRDAVSRDQALDAFEAFVRRKLDERIQARARQIEEHQAQIAELQRRCADLAEQSKADEEQWRQWRQRKWAAEDDLAWALGFLVEEPPITREDRQAKENQE